MSLHKESLEALEHIKKFTRGAKIVFVSGIFNILHPGHLRLLRFASECGDYLVAGVLDHRSKGATVAEELRLESIQSITWVNYAFILRDSVVDFIRELKPAFVVKGKEHEEMYNPESEVLEKIGGKLLFSSGDIAFSSIDFIRQEWNELNFTTVKKPLDFQNRHGFGLRDQMDVIERMRRLRVGVIGDTILDEYITCDPLGMSQEDPTLVVMPVLNEKYIGGAAIVAAHAKGLGSNVHFFTVTGKDEASEFVRQKAEHYGIQMQVYQDESRLTTLKQRYRSHGKTLLRVSHLRQHAVSSEIQNRIIGDIANIIDDIDLMIFADFNYGCLPQPLCDSIIDLCERKGIMMAADSQSSSQVGDISRFKKMTLITPTEREARLAVHDFESGLVVLADNLKNKSGASNIIITLDMEGILIHADITGNNSWLTDRLPALNVAPKDVAGAGDSFFTCASMALAVGADIWISSYLGSLAAAIQVGRLGNIPLKIEELIMEVNS